MKKNKLMWAAALPLAFAACSQEEVVNNPNEVAPEAVAQYKGAQVVENPQFSISKEDDGVSTRMATTDGIIGWEEGDQVGLVWLNAMAISENFVDGGISYSDWYPTTNLHYSNTRITHDGNSVFSMQDGQLYAGQYIAYHPYDADMKQVGIFSLKQDEVQTQSTSAVLDDAAYDYLAKNMNWLSRSAENKTGKSSFLYHIDANKAGLVKTIHIPMRRYSNIFEARFTEVNGPVSSIEWADLTINSMELVATSEVFPTETRFNLNKGIKKAKYELERGTDGNYVELNPTEWDSEGNPIVNYKKDETGYPAKFVIGLQQVGPTSALPALQTTDSWFELNGLKDAITLNIQSPAKVGDNAEAQRAMFLLMPTTKAIAEEAAEGETAEEVSLSLKINTDYGYIIIPESEWKAYIGVDPDPVVNGTNWGSQDMFQSYEGLKEAGKTATELLSLIGQKITRFVPVNTDNLVYNNITVSNMTELLTALDKWNKLGEDGTFNVIVAQQNNFENFDWGTGSQYEEIRTFLNDDKDDLNISGARMNLSGATKLDDLSNRSALTIACAVTQTNGTMDVKESESIDNLIVNGGATLTVDKDETLSTKYSTLKGTSDINGTLTGSSVSNYGVINVAKGADVTMTSQYQNEIGSTANVEGTIDAKNVINNNVMTIASTGVVNASNVMQQKGTMTLDQNAQVNVTGTLKNGGEIVTNGDITASKVENNGDYRIKTHSTTEVETFINNSNIYYDEQGAAFDYENSFNTGKSVATINNSVNNLADYITAANKFGCNKLVINPNDNLTTTQWDNSLNTATLNFTEVEMNDGVVMNFNKDLSLSKATVTIPAGATVSWKKGETTIDTPKLEVEKIVVNSGTTLNVEGIKVMNAQKTEVNFGNEGETVTINGTNNFAVQGTATVGNSSNGTIVTKP